VERHFVKMVWPILASLIEAGSSSGQHYSGIGQGDHQAPTSQQWFVTEPIVTDQPFVPEIYIPEDKVGDTKH
jgi:hypothetical protein